MIGNEKNEKTNRRTRFKHGAGELPTNGVKEGELTTQ
jgi:hypothetical protein